MASCWLMKDPTTITTYSYLEINMRVWLLVNVFFALYDDKKSTFAISSEIPSYFFPGQCQSTGNPGKKHCNLWTAQEK